jgi:anaerobic selenocysteine-containing dehydrogenase
MASKKGEVTERSAPGTGSGNGGSAPRRLLPQVTELGERMQQYPPTDSWDHWTEWDQKAWPRKVSRDYMLVPTVCFNCESACGLLGWVDKETLQIRKFEGNPAHPGSRGRWISSGAGRAPCRPRSRPPTRRRNAAATHVRGPGADC